MPLLTLKPVSSPLRAAFAISRGAKTSAETLVVTLSEDGHAGRGECVPYARYGESIANVTAQIETVRPALEAGAGRDEVQALLAPGAARCAVDCALWDLQARQTGVPVWQRAGLPPPRALPTTMTLSLANPAAMASAAQATPAALLKLKLGGEGDLARIEAVHLARPDARLILDANEGMDASAFPALVAAASELGVVLIEQPFAADNDDALLRRPGKIAICADESVHTADDIQALARKYDAINIKLDKAGGLTHALVMLHEARACGLGVMVGCMVAGSISMAPAVLLGQAADLIDLDGPLWLAQDVSGGLHYDRGTVSPPSRGFWG